MMEYKGYIGQVELDEKAGIFHGDVINLRDVVTFQGETVKQLRQAFQDSIDDYLEFCSERGESPEKPYSGKFMLRMDPELHKKLAVRAKLAHKSLNAWIRDALESTVKQNALSK